MTSRNALSCSFYRQVSSGMEETCHFFEPGGLTSLLDPFLGHHSRGCAWRGSRQLLEFYPLRLSCAVGAPVKAPMGTCADKHDQGPQATDGGQRLNYLLAGGVVSVPFSGGCGGTGGPGGGIGPGRCVRSSISSRRLVSSGEAG